MADVFNIAGRIHSTSQEEVVTTTNEILDATQEKKQSEVNQEVSEELALHTNRLNALTGQNYVTVVATQSTTAADIPTLINASGEGEQADTLYRVGFWDGSVYVADKYTEYAWNGTAYVILDVKSSIGEVFDISLYKAVGGVLATFADLSAALDGGNNVPAGVRQGGMSIKFVQSSDNNYVQFRYMSSSTANADFTNVANWQGVDKEPTVGSENLIESGAVAKFLKITVVYSEENYSILDNGKWGTAPGYKHAAIPVTPGETYWIEVLDGMTTRVAFTTSNQYASGDDIDLVSGTSVITVNRDGLYIVKIIEGCSYLVFNVKTSSYYQVGRLYKLDDAYKSSIFKSGETVVDVSISGVVADNDSLVEGRGIVGYVANTCVNVFPYIKNKIPIYSSIGVTKSFTLPSGTHIIVGDGYVSLSSDVVFEKPDDNFSSHYLILDCSNSSVRYAKANVRTITLSSTEVVVALVDWDNNSVINGNFLKFEINDKIFDTYICKDDFVSQEELSIYDATIDSRFDAVESEIEGLYDTIIYDSSNLESGYYDLSGSTVLRGGGNSWSRIEVNVNKYDTLIIKTVGGNNARAWGLADYEGNILSKADKNVDTTDVPAIITIKANCKLYVNCNANDISNFGITIKRLRVSEGNKTDIPCLFNPKVDLRKSGLKVFDIGNSYTNDATHYLPDIIDAAGITVDYSHYKAVRSSGSFKTWVDCYNDSDDAVYIISKSTGIDIAGIAGEGSANDGSLFRSALAAGWDIILIHQVSTYANDFSVWEGDGNGGYLKEFIRMLRHTNPNAAIGFLLIHSYRGTYNENTEGSSLERWKNIAKSTKEFASKYGIDFVIPYGTAVQNLRATTLSDSNEFSTDGTHMANGIGDYVAGCCYFQCLFAPRFNKSIVGNTWRKTDFDETTAGVKNIDNTNAVLAQKAAFLAAYDWYNINNPDEVDLW